MRDLENLPVNVLRQDQIIRGAFWLNERRKVIASLSSDSRTRCFELLKQESTVLQSGIGNGAIAAQATAPTDQLDFAPAPTPSFIFPTGYYPTVPADSYLEPGFEPSGLYSPLLATSAPTLPSTSPETVPLVTPLDEEMVVEPYGPTPESTPQQPVTTIVFEEETIVGRVPEAEKPATTEGEPKKEGEAVTAEPAKPAKDEKTKEDEKAAEETAGKAKTD